MGAVASISNRVGDLGGYLREQREHAKLSVRQLATLAGVSNPYLSQVERGLRHPSAEVLQQIAKGLRISAEALYVRAGILDEEPRQHVEAAIQADLELNERQKRVLLDIYASFRAENVRARVTREAPVDEAAVEAAVDAAVEAASPAPRRRGTRAAAKGTAVKTAARPRRATKRAAARSAGGPGSADLPGTADPVTDTATDTTTDTTTDATPDTDAAPSAR
jgi:transcriptional regulator with XRE-family HTH domain